MPTKCGSSYPPSMRVLVVEDEPYMAEAIATASAWKRSRQTSPVTATPLWSC